MSGRLEGPEPHESSPDLTCSSAALVPHVLPVMLGGVAKWLLARGEGTKLVEDWVRDLAMLWSAPAGRAKPSTILELAEAASVGRFQNLM